MIDDPLICLLFLRNKLIALANQESGYWWKTNK